jgi:hypothetical protein
MWRYWKKKIREGVRCPRCGNPLVQKYQTYLVLLKHGSEIDPFISGTNGGYFCASCPTIVLDREKFEEIIHLSFEKNKLRYMVTGLIDMEAVPPEKRHRVHGEDDNPLPLVEFKEPMKSRRGESGKLKPRNRKIKQHGITG